MEQRFIKIFPRICENLPAEPKPSEGWCQSVADFFASAPCSICEETQNGSNGDLVTAHDFIERPARFSPRSQSVGPLRCPPDRMRRNRAANSARTTFAFVATRRDGRIHQRKLSFQQIRTVVRFRARAKDKADRSSRSKNGPGRDFSQDRQRADLRAPNT